MKQLSVVMQNVEQTPIIGDYESAPHYMKINCHITHGYRVNFNTPLKIVKSLFILHNQSGNIWTHLAPALFICIMIFSFFIISSDKKYLKNDNFQNDYQMNIYPDQFLDNKKSNQQYISVISRNCSNCNIINENICNTFNSTINSSIQVIQMDTCLQNSIIYSENKNVKNLQNLSFHPNHDVPVWPLLVFLVSAVICLLCSAIFHLFYSMSSVSYRLFIRFDFAGMSVLAPGSVFPGIYYSMYCNLEESWIYFTMLTIAALGVFLLTFSQWMYQKEKAVIKALIFTGFGAANILPLVQLYLNENFAESNDAFTLSTSIPYYYLLGASYIIGAIIYGLRCPERHYPGKFNLCGHSHQIWHILVVLGMTFTFLGSYQSYVMRANSFCPISPNNF